MKKRALSVLLAFVLVLGMLPVTASAVSINDSSVFIRQNKNNTCTLASATMMLRRKGILDRDAYWEELTEAAVGTYAWSGGLRYSFMYNGLSVTTYGLTSHGIRSLSAKKEYLLNLLSSHPEGIVIYNHSKPHAVLLTDYDSASGTFYCADPWKNAPAGRIPLSSSTLPGSGQDGKLSNIDQVWYIASGTSSRAGTMTEAAPITPEVTVSYNQMGLAVGQGREALVSVKSSGTCVVNWSTSDSRIAACQWGQWNSSYNQIPLLIQGNGAGTATITVRMLDGDGVRELDRKTITVKVTCTPNFAVSGGTGTLNVGQSETRTVDIIMNGVNGLSCDLDKNVCSLKWGAVTKSDGQASIPLTLTGKAPGTTQVKVYATDFDGNRIGGPQTFTVTVKNPAPPRIITDKTGVRITAGQTGTVTTSYEWNGGVKAIFKVQDAMVCSAGWKKVDDSHWNLNIYGKTAGTTTITIQMLDSNDQVVAEYPVSVQVEEAKPAAEPLKLTVSPASLSLAPNGSGQVDISWSGDASKVRQVKVDYDATCLDPAWGTKGTASRQLLITPRKAGSSVVKVSLLDSGGGVLAQGETKVTVSENKPQISFAVSSLTLTYGKTVTVDLNLDGAELRSADILPSKNLQVEVPDSNAWAGSGKRTVTAEVTGLDVGEGACRIEITDCNGQSAFAQIPITVTASGSIVDYVGGVVHTYAAGTGIPSNITIGIIPNASDWETLTDDVSSGGFTTQGSGQTLNVAPQGFSSTGSIQFEGASSSTGASGSGSESVSTGGGTQPTQAQGSTQAVTPSGVPASTPPITPTPAPTPTPAAPGVTAPGAAAFTDVPAGAWFTEAVTWAVDRGITNGTGDGTTFSPETVCSVSEILTFLWRASGKPEPTIANPYADVAETAFYYKPALWAYEQGMVSGNQFRPTTPCTRSMTVTYLWQAAGSPFPDAAASFTDVPGGAEYASAVSWAVGAGVTTGTGDGSTFSPGVTCSRGQIATFLYRTFGP